MKFGQYIKLLREAKQLSQREAAIQLGMTPQKLCDIEQGRRYFQQPPYALLRKVAAVYEHPYANLVTNSEFFTYEKSVISELLADIEPLTDNMVAISLEMLLEAKQYTPEMESAARATHELAQQVKMALLLAKARVNSGPSGKTPTGARTPPGG